MQQDAINRVLEMQERASRTLEASGMGAEGGNVRAPHEAERTPSHSEREADHHHADRPAAPSPLSGLLGSFSNLPLLNFSIDSEDIILLLLIYILYKDGADMWLLLALAYIFISK